MYTRVHASEARKIFALKCRLPGKARRKITNALWLDHTGAEESETGKSTGQGGISSEKRLLCIAVHILQWGGAPGTEGSTVRRWAAHTPDLSGPRSVGGAGIAGAVKDLRTVGEATQGERGSAGSPRVRRSFGRNAGCRSLRSATASQERFHEMNQSGPPRALRSAAYAREFASVRRGGILVLDRKARVRFRSRALCRRKH